MTDTVAQGLAIALGACVGSFLNVVIWRVPQGTFLSGGSRSACPKCGVPIPWYRNLPILSWLMLRGRAACCGTRISPRYLLVEALTAFLFWALLVRPPTGLPAWPPALPNTLVYLLHAYFLSVLVACSAIDFDKQLLPFVLTKPGMVVGAVGSLLLPAAYGKLPLPQLTETFNSVLFSLSGLLLGYGMIKGVAVLGALLFRKEAMGGGDVKFMGMIGAFLGWEGVLWTFFLGCLFGGVTGIPHRLITGREHIAFGPFLALGAVLSFFYAGPIREFVLVTWPRWQEQTSAHAPVVTLSLSAAAIVFLIVIIRRGRSR